MAIDPTDEQLQKLVDDSTELTGEVVMLNLLKFRKAATDGGGGTGEDAYGRYAEVATAKIGEYGGRMVWMGRADSVIIGDEDSDDWDAVMLVSYPNRSAFMDFVGDPEYQKGHVHREGALERMKLIAMTPTI